MFDIVIVAKALLITLEEVLKGPGIYWYFLKNPGKVLELMKQMSWKIRKRVLESSGKSFFLWQPWKFLHFLLAHFNSFFNEYLFFKFINKCQTQTLRCAPPSSHVCEFYTLWIHQKTLLLEVLLSIQGV